MEIPGEIGYQVFGDKAVDFYSDMPSYIQKSVDYHNSKVFQSRFLLKPTVFFTSNASVCDLLKGENADDLRLGYKDYFQALFGDIILFSDGTKVKTWRKVFHERFDNLAPKLFKDAIEDIVCNKWIPSIEFSQPSNIYHFMKHMSMQISLALFLDLKMNNINREETQNTICEVQYLITKHWHGLISVPWNLRIPHVLRSAYHKAVDAKKKLMEIINSRLSPRLSNENDEMFLMFKDCEDFSKEDLANHLLLFISALAPKALASILTSFILSRSLWEKEFMNEDGSISDENLDYILLEIYRCWPPFLGGRRVAKTDTEIAGYRVPEGHGVIFVSWAAHRDPDVFNNPDTFDPNRWKTTNRDDKDKIFCFGAGERACLGMGLVNTIIKLTCHELLKLYSWEIDSEVTESLGNFSLWKYLPVARLKSMPNILFVPRQI